jgi:hypothetical protein
VGWWNSFVYGGGNCCPIEECHMGCYSFASPGALGYLTIFIVGVFIVWMANRERK